MTRDRISLSLILPTLALAAGCAVDDPEAAAHSDTLAEAAAAVAGDAAPGPLTITGVADARPVITTDEQRHLVYELVLQNTGATAIEITRVDVRDADRRNALATYQGDALATLLAINPADGPAATIAPGGLAIAFFDVALARGCHLPDRLAHRIAVRTDGVASVAAAAVDVRDDRARGLSSPLRGDRLLDLNGCCDGAHRRALLPIAGELFLAQRFAIDFVRIDDDSTFEGDPTRNESYFVFGADVLAVTSGRIVATRDGMAENTPTLPLPPATIETAAGNHVVQELADGRFALYAHFKNGSVRVRPGDRVRRGDVLGLVGNTGNSTQPHLHFHVMDRPSPLGADGLPYTFDRFDLQATVDITGEVPVIVPVPPPQRRRARLPMDLDIIAFP